MEIKLVFLVLLSLLSIVQSENRTDHVDEQLSQSRITGGKDVGVNALLHGCSITIFNLIEGKFYLGGGTIISTSHVLTSASLIHLRGSHYRIQYYAANNAQPLFAYSDFGVKHPEFNPATLANDIAIVYSKTKFPTLNIVPVADYVPIENTEFIYSVVGFGMTSASDPNVAITPQYAFLTSRGSKLCAVTAATQMCAFRNIKNQDFGTLCPGDIGSGLTRRNMKHILIGIVTRLPDNRCVSADFVTYTPVGRYNQWIRTLSGINRT